MTHLSLSLLRSAWQPTRMIWADTGMTGDQERYKECRLEGLRMLKHSITTSKWPKSLTSSGILVSSIRNLTVLSSTWTVLAYLAE